jgi:hypothetical protein
MTKEMLKILPRLLRRTNTDYVFKYLAWNMSREEAAAMRRLLDAAEQCGCPRTMKYPRDSMTMTEEFIVRGFDREVREREAKSSPAKIGSAKPTSRP